MIRDSDTVWFLQVPVATKTQENATVDVAAIAANVIVTAATAVRVSGRVDWLYNTLAPGDEVVIWTVLFSHDL